MQKKFLKRLFTFDSSHITVWQFVMVLLIVCVLMYFLSLIFPYVCPRDSFGKIGGWCDMGVIQ